MFSYPNQYKIIIEKKIEKEDIFIMLSWKEYCQAAKELSPSALNLFMYLAKNQDGYEFWLSPKDYYTTFGVTEKTYRNAKRELIDKGYLKEKDTNKITFNSRGAFKRTKESVKEELKRLYVLLQQESPDSLCELKDQMMKIGLHGTKDDDIYISKAQECINFAEDLIKNFSEKEFNNLV